MERTRLRQPGPISWSYDITAPTAERECAMLSLAVNKACRCFITTPGGATSMPTRVSSGCPDSVPNCSPEPTPDLVDAGLPLKFLAEQWQSPASHGVR